ncbi:unnamed protein product [Periconia digitata]|uniref:Uncharacterized protein n=1 Tax=Periconia digitata TaxID=1303443 RepID=A0A9W4XSA2_9PLEO|nr:unnamed protein product [Periconia digitata]
MTLQSVAVHFTNPHSRELAALVPFLVLHIDAETQRGLGFGRSLRRASGPGVTALRTRHRHAIV